MSTSIKNILKDKVFILIIIFGIISFLIIGSLLYYSLTTIEKKSISEDTIYYQNIIGEWTDYNNNLIRINNRGTYNWYQDYSNNKKDYLKGNIEVVTKNEALQELDISLAKIKSLLNVLDVTEENVYYLKLYTGSRDINYAYYKLLAVNRDEELLIYNYNDQVIYHLNKYK